MNAELSAQIVDRFEREAWSHRHLAREIHDTVANHVVSANLLLGRLRQGDLEDAVRRSLDELNGQLDLALRDLRSCCFLLDVPEDFENGSASQLRGILEGFCRRAGLALTYQNDLEKHGLGQPICHVVLRILQEALVNVARHARARDVAVRCRVRGAWLRVEVVDNGRGIPSSAQSGVGMRSMAARAREAGGRLMVRSSGQGTTISALLPLS